MGFRMPITLDERKEIKRLLLTGMSCTQIASRINRSKNSVVTEVRINGGKDSYDPKKGNERAVLVHKQGRESMMDKQKIAANDVVNKQRYVHVTALIQAQQREIEELKEQIQILLSRKVFRSEPVANKMEKRIRALELKYKAVKDGDGNKEVYSIVHASEWHKYHRWPDSAGLMKLIRERESNGLKESVFKIGKRWMVDEEKFLAWSKEYKESLIKGKES